MAEAAIGVAASAVTLAALFSSCIECFSYFKAAQNCPSEAETLLVKLDCEKARLLTWGNTVGILQTDSRNRYPQLEDLKQDDLIRRCINQIISLLTDAQELQVEYGGRATDQQESQRYLAVLSVNSMNVFQAAKRTFFARAGAKHVAPKLLSRIKWAIRDAAKFRILILNLKDFVDNLIQLVPVPPETINSMVEEDIVSTIDINSLRLIADSCDEDSYPQWSARATEIIRESEIGTADRRNLTELLNDSNADEGAEHTSSRPKKSHQMENIFSALDNAFVVMSDKCLNLESGKAGDCRTAKIGSIVTGNLDVQVSFCSSTSTTWNLGRRLLDNITLHYQVKEELKQREAVRLETMKLTAEIPSVKPICTVYVYCGVCACAINTARILVDGHDLPEFFDFSIRIDDRIPTSCGMSDSTIHALTAVRDAIDEREASAYGMRNRSLRAIDCPALERRIYALEQEDYDRIETENVLQRILTERNKEILQNDIEMTATIVVSEADICTKSLERHPFSSLPRKPRASDLYALKSHHNGTEWLWRREFIGRFSKSKLGVEMDRTRNAASQVSLPQDSSSNLSLKPATPPRKRRMSDSITS